MNDVFEQYGLFFDSNGRHLYKEDLVARDYYLESTTPVSFAFGNFCVEETTWVKLLPKIIDFLFSISPKTKQDALDFRTVWTKAPLFYKAAVRTNLAPLANGLYLNVNFTALHSVWCLQDCLDFFEIPRKECTLIIHRPCAIEPEAIRKFFKEERTTRFRDYLLKVYGHSQEKADIAIHNIGYFSKVYLRSFSKSYDDFFLFDSILAFSNYSARLLKKIHESNDQRTTKIADRCFLFLKGFYSAIY